MRTVIRSIIYFFAFIFLIPFFVASRLRICSFLTLNTILSYFPGMLGVFVRRVWYKLNLAKCGRNFYVDFGGVMRTRKAKVGDDSYIGRYCLVGNVDMGSNVIISHQSFIMSETRQHGIGKNRTINEQMQKSESFSQTKIGDDSWICLNCVVGADIAPGTVVGANSFVNKSFEPYSVIGGVPAKFLKKRT
ncbi:acyltransferase [Candidatus Peregrinibacteria bacterium]|nr:acyltransferase [Candidatus Peregrinibacteria bacterium]